MSPRMQGDRTETFQKQPQGNVRWSTRSRAEHASHRCGPSTNLGNASHPVTGLSKTLSVSVLHQQHPCNLNIFNPCTPRENIVIVNVVHERTITAYPLFIAKRFSSSGLFAGPLLQPPDILHQVCLKHLVSTMTSATRFEVPHTWVGSIR